MNLTEAYDYIDVLLDKADQPYFIQEEKDKFLNLAISDFVNMHYQKMLIDEDSRRAISGCIDWNSWSLSSAEIISGTFLYDNRPSLSAKYDDSTATFNKGFFKFGNQYVLPKQHLYVISANVKMYNKDEIIDGAGNAYPGVTTSDVVFTDTIPVKNVSTRDYYQLSYSKDPFNKSSKENVLWQYIENRMVFSPGASISYISLQTLTLPTVGQAFSTETYDNSTAPASFTFAEHYQKQIVQIAVKRMTQTDIGLMTPPE